MLALRRLNPFEVREVLQELKRKPSTSMKCLNPFEVREVLQERTLGHHWPLLVSIPLKSGRCCKFFRRILTNHMVSQSLWSQGGAARVLYKTYLLKSISYMLVFVKNFLTKSYFPNFCKDPEIRNNLFQFSKQYLRFSILRYSRSVSHIFSNLSWC